MGYVSTYRKNSFLCSEPVTVVSGWWEGGWGGWFYNWSRAFLCVYESILLRNLIRNIAQCIWKVALNFKPSVATSCSLLLFGGVIMRVLFMSPIPVYQTRFRNINSRKRQREEVRPSQGYGMASERGRGRGDDDGRTLSQRLRRSAAVYSADPIPPRVTKCFSFCYSWYQST